MKTFDETINSLKRIHHPSEITRFMWDEKSESIFNFDSETGEVFLLDMVQKKLAENDFRLIFACVAKDEELNSWYIEVYQNQFTKEKRFLVSNLGNCEE